MFNYIQRAHVSSHRDSYEQLTEKTDYITNFKISNQHRSSSVLPLSAAHIVGRPSFYAASPSLGLNCSLYNPDVSSFFQILLKYLIKPNKPICVMILVDENNFNQFSNFHWVTVC